MSRRFLPHLCVAAALAGLYFWDALAIHGLRYTVDSFEYIDNALAFFDSSGFIDDRVWEYGPLHPLWLGGLMHLDPAFAETLRCMRDTLPRWPGWEPLWETFGGVHAGRKAALASCRPWSNVGFPAQVLLGAFGVAMIWLAGWLASGRAAVAHLAAFTALLLGASAHYSGVLKAEGLVIPLFAGANVCLAGAVLQAGRGPRAVARVRAALLGCGALFGTLILTRPPYEYVLAAVLLAACARMLFDRARRREIATAIVLVLVAAAAVTAPWVARNWTVSGIPGLGRGGHVPAVVLDARLDYNAMTGRQWLAAFPFWSSKPGERLAEDWFGADTVAPFRYKRLNPEQVFTKGWSVRTLLRERRFALLSERLWADLPWHLAVSLPLAWRGMNQFQLTPEWLQPFGIVFWALAILGFARGTPRNRRVLAALALCPAALLAINALVSISEPRFAVGLVTPLSVGVALSVVRLLDGARGWLHDRPPFRRWASAPAVLALAGCAALWPGSRLGLPPAPGGPAADPLAEARHVFQSRFDGYVVSGRLVYVREPCAAEDTAARILLHVVPVDERDLPESRRRHGFEDLDFHFLEWGGRVGRTCITVAKLPRYRVASVRTGQYVPGEGRLWQAEFTWRNAPGPARPSGIRPSWAGRPHR